MQTTEITLELKQMNRYWFMLSATLNELDTALNQGDYTPEERLAKVRVLYDHMRSHMPPAAPPSVAAEAHAREAERAGDEADEPEMYYRRTADGTFEGYSGPLYQDTTLADSSSKVLRSDRETA